ncbi:MAG: peptidylprolyl isomerase [Candidatus Jettenia sp. CY-1]|nr:peptidylprolyl isomerase [Candidatus Jettenia sp.]WKZ18095.1 MAG: peptidylprolyl isomerase [Candidatus Jettenia sp. CY-1]
MNNNLEGADTLERGCPLSQTPHVMSEVNNCCGTTSKLLLMIFRLLREPLVHFLILGAVLFCIFIIVNQGDNKKKEGTPVVITHGRIQQLRETFTAQRGRSPTEEELHEIIEDHIREEILYREAMHLGLDRDDTIIRRRLAQKIQFLYEDLLTVKDPTDTELQQYFTAHADLYRQPDRLSFVHIYFSTDRRGVVEAEKTAQALLTDLRKESISFEPPELGDPFLLQHDCQQYSEQEVAELFGNDFARAVFSLKTGEWEGPVLSSYGIHLVMVSERLEGRMPSLSEVHSEVENDWRYAWRQETNIAAYQRLRERYEVVIEKEESAP